METPKDELEEKAREEQETLADENKQETPQEEKPKKAKKSKPATPFKTGERGILSAAQKKHVVLVTDEGDPLYNPKVREKIPEGMVESLERFGWNEATPLTILPDGRILNGRTKWRAVEKAKLDIEIPFVVTSLDEDAAADLTDALDMHVQKLNPMIVAEKVFRALSRGKTEKEIQTSTGIPVNDQHGYLLLLDEERCPPTVQEMLRAGQISFTAALELAKRADKMTKGEVQKAAEEIAKVANGGVRLTSAQVKKAAGVDAGSPATAKQKKQLILDLQSADLRGKHGQQVAWAAIIGLEVALGTRTVDSAWVALKKLADGHSVKVDFKQYQGEKAKEE